ncbi:MAG: hypothetical protein JSR87_00105 [Proteobacteria bacterium]|nr:hypothetical protein [Pseudomonadota bacterium]MBS0571709.1 hypothetical protein [Pseudomonadota bacterium]
MMFRTAAAVLASSLVAVPAWAQIDNRQQTQFHRIVQGWQSDELTGHEAASLVRQQAGIARTEARMRADGGGLSPAERARLHLRQDRASVSIYARKHNDRTR